MGAFVEIRGIVRRFGEVVAVAGADLDVEQGSLVALLGPSGCGKTTLLRLIGGLDVPSAGTIALDGAVMSGPGAFLPPERRHIGMVFQDYALFPHMSVARNLAFGLPRGSRKSERVRELLELVGLQGLEDRMPHELSGGQQQRVSLARALAAEPRLLLLDEPFSNLDPAIRVRVRDEVRELIRAIGITAIFVTHDQDEALSLADKVAVMFNGKVHQVGAPRDVYEQPATRAVAEFIGRPNFLAGTASAAGEVTCELGTFRVDDAAPGPVDVMVRAEDIVRVATGGIAATVTKLTYLGHEQLAALRLESGQVVEARWRSSERARPGDTVRVMVCGNVRAYPRE